MDRRVLLFLIMVNSSWCCNARDLTANPFNGKSEIVSDLQSYNNLSKGEAQHVEEVDKNEKLCMLCEEFASEAFSYLSENETQTEIINILHKSCTKIPTFKQQCIVLVDYYAPPFFLGVSSIQPEDICQKVDLCNEVISISQHLSKDKCDICHSVVAEALQKLKDPDTELDIVKLLLKACDSIGKSVKQCKRLVFEYMPILLVNAELFLETKDLCTILHACNSTSVGAEEPLLGTQISMHAAS